jgi:hypothetical protein
MLYPADERSQEQEMAAKKVGQTESAKGFFD